MSCTGKERRATTNLGSSHDRGHANAARGEPILRMIGLGEDGHQVTGSVRCGAGRLVGASHGGVR
jgi:hypothetical protein